MAKAVSTWAGGLPGSAAIPRLMGTDGSKGWLTGPLGVMFASVAVAVARVARRSNATRRTPHVPD